MLHVAPLGFLSFPTGGYVPAGAIWLDGSADYLSWTPSGAADSDTIWTASAWVKRAGLGSLQRVFVAGDVATGNNFDAIYFDANDKLNWQLYRSGLLQGAYTTTAVFRDASAWMHVHVTRSGATVTISVNGEAITAFDTSTAPDAGDQSMFMQSGEPTTISYQPWGGTNRYNGYIAEAIMLDGTASAVSNFGETDTNGNWVPIDPSGLTFSGNSFWLSFSDPNDLGKDASAGTNANDFYENITSDSLTTNLELCLDAGDSSSYSSGQKWLDLSGNGYDFFLGADGTATTDDPTFNGTAGDLKRTNYWSFDGGDVFTYDTTNETWMDNMHKSGASYTIAGWFYTGTVADEHWLWGTGSATTGVALRVFSGGAARINIYNGASSIKEITTSDTMSDEAWHFFALSYTDGAGAFFYLDGNYMQVASADTFDGSLSGAATGSASTMEIGGRPGSGSPDKLLNGDRVAGFMAWSTNLSKANLDSLYASTSVRFAGNNYTLNSIDANNAVSDRPADDATADPVVGNYATPSPLDPGNANDTFANGNLDTGSGSGGNRCRVVPFALQTGKWYWEVTHGGGTVGSTIGLIGNKDTTRSNYPGYDTNSLGVHSFDGDLYDGSGAGGILENRSETTSNTDVWGIAFDADNRKLWVSLNGTYFDSGDPAAGTNADFTSIASDLMFPLVVFDSRTTLSHNFGQTAFNTAPPSGFKAPNTANLPAPTPAASATPITGSFTGNANADGPVVWLGYTPDTSETSTINSNTITWGTHALPTAGGMKIITSSASYNTAGSNTYSIAVEHPFGGEGVSQARAR